jgi:hypothetical protein
MTLYYLTMLFQLQKQCRIKWKDGKLHRSTNGMDTFYNCISSDFVDFTDLDVYLVKIRISLVSPVETACSKTDSAKDSFIN